MEKRQRTSEDFYINTSQQIPEVKWSGPAGCTSYKAEN